jgi:hypothetical protein
MITVIDKPYNYALRGQKLMIIANSDSLPQDGFKYGVEVAIGDGITSKSYTFYLSPAVDDNLYFDIAPLLDDMRNYEPSDWHYKSGDTFDDLSRKYVDITLTEWWLINGILTLSEGSENSLDRIIVVNGYFQALDGYKPNVETGAVSVRQSLFNDFCYAMSDRLYTTHNLQFASSLSYGNWPYTNCTLIPAFDDDYGMLTIPGNNTYLSNNDQPNDLIIVLMPETGIPVIETIPLSGFDIEALPVYPANLNDWVGISTRPYLYPNWKFIIVATYDGVDQRNAAYVFYNASVYGQKDCRYEKIRLGWVNSRGGWDYFNFIKKSEITDEIERKTFRKVLLNNSPTVFSTIDRGLTERRNIVQQVMTITSDYIQEGEFLFLRSLLASNQVTWLGTRNNIPIAIPVKLDDNSYTEKRTRDGKLYNLTLKVRMANEYWT